MGAAEYAMRIWLRPDVLDYYGISVDQIIDAIATQAGAYPAGQFGAEPAPRGTQSTFTVTLPRQLSTAEEFSRIMLRTTDDGRQVYLSDVADVTLGSQSYGTQSLFEDRPTAVIVVYQEPGSNAVAVADRVKTQMSQAAERFPDGLNYATIVDGTSSIKAGIEEIVWTLIASLLLVMAIIFLFIQDWRATIIPLVAIPVSIVGTFIAFPLLGVSINVVSLLGLVLAIGLVVDDAIVVVEAVQVGIEKGLKPFDATVAAMKSVTAPVIATSVVLLAVFIPVSFTGGITGKLFQQFAVTISVAVFFSTINALTLSPALCAVLLKPKVSNQRTIFSGFNRAFDRFMARYSGATERGVQRTKVTKWAIFAILAIAVLLWNLLPSGFLPNEDQGYLMVAVNGAPATSLQITQESMASVDRVIRSRKDVESTAVVAGFNMLSGTAATNSGVIFVRLVDFSDRKLSSEEISEQLNYQFSKAFQNFECYAFIQPAIPGLGVTSGVTFALLDTESRGSEYLGENLAKLLDTLNRNSNFSAAYSQFNNSVPQKQLVVDREHAMMKGVNLSELYNELSALLGSQYIDNFTRFGRLYRSYIAAAPEYRQTEESLKSYFVASSDGQSVPLSTFVTVKDTVGVSFVEQFNLYNAAQVTATPAKGVSTAQAMEQIEAISNGVLPDDMTTTWSGVSLLESKEGGKSWLVYLIALAFVFLILSILYESWKLPIAILLAVPLAILGALIAIGVVHLFNVQIVNDIYMQISLVMLIGLAAKNAILVVEYADKSFQNGADLLTATVEAAKLRARPIIMTASAFVLGVLPLVFASGVFHTARNVMGIALVGGMVAATTIGILLYPALYYLIKKL
jgi:HAE1 family hydrophobic/amphiphilic exporter-1